MKTATVRELKQELGSKTEKELLEICLTLSKFKKENKELLTYLLYEQNNEEEYIDSIKEEMKEAFRELSSKTSYWTNKSVRKILRTIKKFIRYSKKTETEIELLLFFSQELKEVIDRNYHSKVLENILEKQLLFIGKKIDKLHEDLQYDYNSILKELQY
jgi:hypothetical protein